MSLTNAEKQARFRKKEGLKKYVNDVYRDCQLMANNPRLQGKFGDLGARLREAEHLPDGWTDEDLERAIARIKNIYVDVMGSGGDPLVDDVSNGRDPNRQGLKTAKNPKKWMADIQKAERDANALAGHLVSALELSQLSKEDCAAALMEPIRYVGRALADMDSDGRSDAMTVCLTALNPHHQRPDWYIDRLAQWLRSRLNDDMRKALGSRLMEDK